jgi:hypothetical protein
MATVVEGYTTEEHPAKDINKEMFIVDGGKYLSRKTVHNSVANVSLVTKRLKRRSESG